eukprot:296-Chlamydomonas_euryale.AAC.2
MLPTPVADPCPPTGSSRLRALSSNARQDPHPTHRMLFTPAAAPRPPPGSSRPRALSSPGRSAVAAPAATCRARASRTG